MTTAGGAVAVASKAIGVTEARVVVAVDAVVLVATLTATAVPVVAATTRVIEVVACRITTPRQ